MIDSWVLTTALAALVLTLVVLLCERFLDARPATRHTLWLLVFVKLALPPLVLWPVWTLPVEVPAFMRPADTAPPAVQHDQARLQSSRQTLTAELSSSASSSSPVVTGAAVQGASSARTLGWRDVRPWLLGLWLAGSSVAALIQARRILRLRRSLRASRPAPAWLTAEVERIAAVLGAPVPRTLLHDCNASPLVTACGRPVLLLPAAWLAGWDSQRRQAVLAHELGHLARRDHWVGWLELCVSVVWWWNPLVPFARRHLHENAELACDARVVALLPITRRSYAETLLEVGAGLVRPVTQRSERESALAFGMAPRDVRTFERRLIMVMNWNEPKRLSIAARAGLVLLAGASVPALALAGGGPGADASQDRRRPVVPEEEHAREERWTTELVHQERLVDSVQELVVDTSVGSITIVRGGDRLRVEATVKADDEVPDWMKTEAFEDHVHVQTIKNRLEIRDLHRRRKDAEETNQPEEEHQGWDVSLRIHLPRPLPVQATSGVGSITVESARESVHLTSGVGTLTLDLPDGKLDTVHASTGAGNVLLDLGSVEKKLRASGGAGDVRLTLRAGANGSVDLSSGAGSLKLVVPTSIAGEFEIETGVGTLTIDPALGLPVDKHMTGSSARGSIGWGGPDFELRTGVGSIEVKALESEQESARPAKRSTV